MKIFRAIAFFLAVSGAVIYQLTKMTVYAASPAGADVTSSAGSSGPQVYQTRCALCHGEKMSGIQPAIPSLTGVGRRMNAEQLTVLIHHGRGRMPAFATSQLSDAELSSLLHYLATNETFNTPLASAPGALEQSPLIAAGAGASVYQQNCAFCHGRDAGGGETGPDLTRSKLVAADVGGDQIAPVVRNGRAEGKMPKFNFSDVELVDLVKFIHAQAKLSASRPGGRRGVDVADLQTGNVAAGKQYFEGAGGCSRCHSPSGDLAGVASRFQGLQLEEQMLYPKEAKDKVVVTTSSGETISGVLAYQDEFVIGLRDATGSYRSWPVGSMKYSIDSPVSAHIDQFPKYTDDDIHNLMSYIQTLK